MSYDRVRKEVTMLDIHEECGVFGLWSPKTYDLARTVYYGLYSLQHRGQESCGIIVNDCGVFTGHKDLGEVGDVFKASVLDAIGQGQIAVGHVRYGTTGATDRKNAQPMVVNHVKGSMAVAHNGNLVNTFTGIASNDLGNWYIKDGLVDFSYTGPVTYNNAVYNVVNGQVQ